MVHKITIEPLTIESFKPYGDVVQLEGHHNAITANQGTAKRVNNVASLTNLRTHPLPSLQQAQPNMCIFSSAPRPTTSGHFKLSLLERHPYSSQVFMPIAQSKVKADADEPAYIVIVAENGRDDRPRVETVRAFAANLTQGINYKPNSWHSPMVCVGKSVDFLVLVWENKVALQDCEEAVIEPVLIDLTSEFKNLNDSKL